ncbi:alpha/beta hydrolase [Bordetella holmesii]|uniref:Hydrolase, alpha/beta domain protein n=2 Tax=Bordetella holmesii TaxID=35814 RepID=A0A158M9C0_9BORD|nr:alpha/beta hydrolase [Bordetella holmesii]AHV94130.1 alpha/beta hydrolase fold family protein [Bordetella holmesii ATCC 51541]EWM42015.1 alpha/beta hydrolase fold family protein [Bordetella holmesii 41130]EWM47173.1 alpha/beta hydrolase fold family protein [Bordetella holmesii 35009]EWM51333.1 alpha/beta hydrolase fold family protein [Bordetella holmesii 70147]AMD45579.1 esterase [Bordetella holmesii H558]
MNMLYRNYDRSALDVQYNARATVPDIQAILKQYTDESRQARHALHCLADISYGPHPDERLDIFPAAQSDAPVFFFIHGGYWRALSKDDSCNMAPTFTAAGATVVVLNYSLAPSVTLDRIVDQTRRALTWVYTHIAQYGGDPRRIHICGSSAGGHLVGMLLAAGWQNAHGLPDDAIHGACALSGLYDLRPLIHTHINAWMHMSQADAERNSPALLPLTVRGCPLIVAYGESETDEFKRQSRNYLSQWQAAGYPAHYVDVPDSNHFDLVLKLNDAQAPHTRAVLEQMGLRA